jgi:hypothetical protein
MDRMALKFHETKDLKVRDEIYRLSRELIKLDKLLAFCGDLKADTKLGPRRPDVSPASYRHYHTVFLPVIIYGITSAVI